MNKKYAFYGFLVGLCTLILMGAKITSNILQLGRGTAEDISIQFNTGSANQPLIKWDNAGSVLKFSNNGTDFFNFGSGSGGGVGGLNYIENGDFEGLNVTGWDEYADAAGATPVDGNGGTPNITVSFNNVTPLNGDGQLRISKDAANRQGEGISYAFTVPPGYRQGQKAGISFVVDASTANYAAGDLAVYVYDVTNSTLITPTVAAIPKAKTPISIAWDQTTGTDFRLIFHLTSTNATAYDIYLDDIVIGPEFPGQLPIIGEWTSYTPTGAWSTNTTYYGKWRRIGSDILLDITVTLSGAPTGTFSTSASQMLNGLGLTLDTSALPNYGTSAGSGLSYQWHIGDCTIVDSGVVNYNCQLMYDANAGTTRWLTTASPAVQISATVPFTWGSSDHMSANIRLPIAEWAGNTSYLGQNNVEYVFNTNTTDASTTGSGYGYGPYGVVFGDFAAARVKEISFNSPIQATDKLTLEYTDDSGTTWYEVGNDPSLIHPRTTVNGIGYGSAVIPISSTLARVYFYPYRTVNTSYGAAGIAWSDIDNLTQYRWRVRKISGGNAVGFGESTTTSLGLIKKIGSYHRVYGTPGARGSTNTAVWRFSSVAESGGSDITYASSATLGDSWTINTTGLYSVSLSSANETTTADICICKNEITRVNSANSLSHSRMVGAGPIVNQASVVYLIAGDVIRVNSDVLGTPSTSAINGFNIARIW